MGVREPRPMSSAPATRPLQVPMPRTWGVRPGDILWLLVANGVFLVLMWIRPRRPR